MGSTPLWSKKRLSSMATTALRRSSSIWFGFTRMRASGERSVAIFTHLPFLPLAQMPPSCAGSGCSYWSRLGRSWAIAVTKPKKAETMRQQEEQEGDDQQPQPADAAAARLAHLRRRRRRRREAESERLLPAVGLPSSHGNGAPAEPSGGPSGRRMVPGGHRAARVSSRDVCRTTFDRSSATPSTCCPRARSSQRRVAEARREGRPLRVKLGLDPTAVSVTLGWSVVLSKLRAFQDAGHLPVLIVGRLHRARRRPQRALEDAADADAGADRRQRRRLPRSSSRRIIDLDRIELRRNSEWLGALGTGGLLELAARSTLARMLERDDFAKRYRASEPISLQELMYPLLQGWDSVQIDADIEIGGTRPDLQPAGGPRPAGADGAAAAGRDDARAARRHRRHAEDEPVARQLRRADRLGRRHVRQDDVDPGRRDAAVVSGWRRDCRRTTSPRRLAALDGGELEPVEGKRRLARGDHGALSRAEAAARGGASASAPSSDAARCRPTPPSTRCRRARRVHLPALLRGRVGAAVALGGAPAASPRAAVRVDGEQLRELDVARARARGARRCRWGAASCASSSAEPAPGAAPARVPSRRLQGPARRFPLDAGTPVPHTPSVAAVGGERDSQACPRSTADGRIFLRARIEAHGL